MRYSVTFYLRGLSILRFWIPRDDAGGPKLFSGFHLTGSQRPSPLCCPRGMALRAEGTARAKAPGRTQLGMFEK